MLAGLRFVLGLVLVVCTSAAAASTHFDTAVAERRLVQFSIVVGGNYPDMDATLTRAQLVTLLVRALGQESTAQLVHGAPTYDDVSPTAWYSGYIVVAKALGIALDTPNNLFFPDQPVALPEALAFTMRAVRLPPWDGFAYPDNHVLAAEDAGSLTSAQAQEIRDAVSQAAAAPTVLALVDQLFFLAPYDGGASLYQTFHSLIAPTFSVTSPGEGEQLEGTLVVEGTAAAAQAHLYPVQVSLLVGGALVGQTELEAEGTWSVDVDVAELHVGSHELVVEAADFAGKKAPAVSRTLVVGAPPVSIVPKLFRFPDQPVGFRSEPKFFEVTNPGPAPVVVRDVVAPGGFGLVDDTPSGCTPGTTLNAGDTCGVAVVFQPDRIGEFDGALKISFSGTWTFTASIWGLGIEVPGSGGAGGSAGEGGAGGSAGEGGAGGTAGEGGAGGSAGEGGTGGSAGQGGAGGSGGEGGAGAPPVKRKGSSSGCSQAGGASIAGLSLIGIFLVRRTARGGGGRSAA